MAKALYRIWRPRVFADVVGQESITHTLKNQVAAGRPAHAYLFSGSRGTGKTTCSKILAQAVNCVSPKDGDPCGVCASCQAAENGSLTDVVEMDAASNNSVDDVRALREEAIFPPALGKYRVYIVDEAHMLSKSAFNAFLKMMEEPPPHVIFILATTEAHKIPPTILSRCQRFDFKRVSSSDIAGRLLQIAAGEGIALTSEAADHIGALADGGVRDAISLLDQCSAMGKEVDDALVCQMAGLADQSRVEALMEHLLVSDLGAALSDVAAFYEAAADFKELTERLLTYYRNLMVVKSVAHPEGLVQGSKKELENLKKQGKQVGLSDLLYGMDTLQDIYRRIGTDRSARALLEMAVIQLCSPEVSAEKAALVARIGALEKGVARKKKTAPPLSFEKEEETENAPSLPKEEAGLQREGPSPVVQVEGPLESWGAVVALLQKKNPPLYATLEGSRAYQKEGFVLIDAPNSVFLDLMRASEATKESLRAAIWEVTGETYRLGPVKEGVEVREQNSPVEALRQAAQSAGIPIEEG